MREREVKMIVPDSFELPELDDAVAGAMLGKDPAGRLELVEADHEDLDRSGHDLVRHVGSPLPVRDS